MTTNQKAAGKGKKLIVFGFVTIAIVFLLYGRYQDPELLTPSAIDSIQRIAYGFYIVLVGSFGDLPFNRSLAVIAI